MTDLQQYRERDEKGRYHASHERPCRMCVTMHPIVWAFYRNECAHEQTTPSLLLETLIEEVYLDYLSNRKEIQEPEVKDEETKPIIVNFRIDKPTRSMLSELAEISGMSTSKAVQTIITNFLAG